MVLFLFHKINKMKNTFITGLTEHKYPFVILRKSHFYPALFYRNLKVQGRMFIVLLISLFMTPLISASVIDSTVIASGQQSQITMDPSGAIRLIFGNDDSIYCATSTDNGKTFSSPLLVGTVTSMHLGMSRGPQAASSKNFSLVTAMDKEGNIHTFLLNHKTGIWMNASRINDIPGSAPEGLMSVAADNKDNFYAVWLDIRNGGHNNICFSSTTDQGTTWTENRIIYESPDKNVCPCCKPNIAVNGTHVYVMFRNWLNGSRDLYLTESSDNGSTFSSAFKLGEGTWKINACPMDGGGLTAGDHAKVLTVWQRKGSIYLAKPDMQERQIGTGRNCNITDADSPVITWQNGKHLKVLDLSTGKETEAGEGGFIQAVRTRNDQILCAWENNGKIAVRLL